MESDYAVKHFPTECRTEFDITVLQCDDLPMHLPYLLLNWAQRSVVYLYYLIPPPPHPPPSSHAWPYIYFHIIYFPKMITL
jgi:hypothetical protein